MKDTYFSDTTWKTYKEMTEQYGNGFYEKQ